MGLLGAVHVWLVHPPPEGVLAASLPQLVWLVQFAADGLAAVNPQLVSFPLLAEKALAVL